MREGFAWLARVAKQRVVEERGEILGQSSAIGIVVTSWCKQWKRDLPLGQACCSACQHPFSIQWHTCTVGPDSDAGAASKAVICVLAKLLESAPGQACFTPQACVVADPRCSLACIT